MDTLSEEDRRQITAWTQSDWYKRFASGWSAMRILLRMPKISSDGDGDGDTSSWRSRTEAQVARNVASHVIEEHELDHYRNWVTEYHKCRCGSHVALNDLDMSLGMMTRVMILGFLDDEKIARHEGIYHLD